MLLWQLQLGHLLVERAIQFIVGHFRLDIRARGVCNKLGVYVLFGVRTV